VPVEYNQCPGQRSDAEVPVRRRDDSASHSGGGIDGSESTPDAADIYEAPGLTNGVGSVCWRWESEPPRQPERKRRETMIVLVYHVRSDAPRGMLFFEQDTTWNERKKHYELVAHGEFDSLEHAWEATQNITHRWTHNNGVCAHRDEVRSTSVGDVLMVVKDQVYEVARVGFRNIADKATSEEVAPAAAGYTSRNGEDD